MSRDIPIKIAFGYKARSGKDTCVEYLIKKNGGVRIGFADPLYDIQNYAQRICGFPVEKDRKFLQWIGTDWAREINPNVWLDIAMNKTNLFTDEFHNENVYISDLRFPNELKTCKDNGFICIKIIRPMVSTVSPLNEHSSEILLDDTPNDEWDHIIINDGTLADLYAKLDKITKT